MKTAGAIRHQLKQIRFRYLKKLIADALTVDSANCVHHRTVHPPQHHQPIEVCFLPEPICEDLICSHSRAQECPHFEVPVTKEEIKAEFMEFLSTATLGQIASEYPDLAALLWVLQDEAPNREVEIDATEDWDVEDTEETEPQYQLEIGDITVQCASEEARETLIGKQRMTLLLMAAVNEALEQCRQDKAALEAERDSLADQIVDLAERNDVLADENQILTVKNAEQEARILTTQQGLVDIRQELMAFQEAPWWHRLWTSARRSNG